MAPAALIFGSLGTLTETSALHLRAFNETFDDEGLDWHWDDATYRSLLSCVGGAKRILRYAAAQDEHPAIDAGRAAQIHERKTDRYAALVRSSGPGLRPGVQRLLDQARSLGVTRGLATGTSLDNISANLDAAGGRVTLDDFDAHTTVDAASRPKPAPDVHLRCLELLDVDPADAIVIEDSADGVAAAVDAGLNVVATPGLFVRDQDFGRAHLVLSSLGDATHPAERLDDGPGAPPATITIEWLSDQLGL